MKNLNHSRTLAARPIASALLVAAIGSALAGVHYVDVNSTNATPPYTNWTTAATNIQDAVDAAVAGDEIVVTNGIYATGGRSNAVSTISRVAVEIPLIVRSVNGPQATAIDGGGSRRCVYLTSSASLSGFTLTNGSTAGNGFNSSAYGGGVYGGTLNNCTLTRNQVERAGGGAYGATLNNCTLSGNFAGVFGAAVACTLNNCTLTGNFGAGAFSSTLYNCTLSGNFGGGSHGCTLTNCIVYFNSGVNYDSYSTLNYCCATPQPTNGLGNITSAPLFVDTNGWSNLRLQSRSPCINAGNSSYATDATDLDGNPRISGGTVDMGAYEFQWPQLTIAPSGLPPSGLLLRWPTNNAGYDYTGFTLQSTTNLLSPSAWTTNSPAPVAIGGQNVVTNPIADAQQFYRLAQ